MRPLQAPSHRSSIVLAVLFWLSAVWRFVHASELHSFYVDILERGIHALKERSKLREVRIHLHLGAELAQRLSTVSARVKLDGAVVSRSGPTAVDRSSLSVDIPQDATGILEIDVVGLDLHHCVVAGGAFEQRLGAGALLFGGREQLNQHPSLSLSLRPLAAPLCD